MRTKLALTVAACSVFGPAAFAADLSTPAPPMSPVPAGHEVLFDGSLGTTYSTNSLTPWTASATARATLLKNGWGVSLNGITQTSITGVPVTVSGAQVQVFKNFASSAVSVAYGIAGGNGISTQLAAIEGKIFSGNATLKGSIGYTFGSVIPSETTLIAQGAYFFTPNTQGFASVTQSWTAAASSTSFFVGAEHKFDSTPISLFADVGYVTPSNSFVAAVGIRLTPRSLSLQAFDRKVPF